MTPTMGINEFEDDYKSDECDEHTAAELFYSAFFNKHSIATSCEEFINAKQRAKTPVEEAKQAAVGLAADTLEIHSVETQAGELSNVGSNGSSDATRPGKPEVVRPTGQTKTKLQFAEAVKTFRETLVSSSKQPVNENHPEAGKLPSTGVVVTGKKCKRKKNPIASSKRKSSRRTTTAATAAPVATASADPTAAVAATAHNDNNIEYIVLDSTDLPTLSPELSSDDEIALSDADGIELNVVSFARGVPDKVSLTPGLSAAEHKRLWHVDIDDKFRHIRKNRYHSVKECRNCRQSGHLTHECREPERIVCILCGDRTHVASRCPEKICSTCKQQGHLSLRCFRMQHLLEKECRICGVFGHTANICPDSWRRYHCTTRDGPPIAPDKDERLPFKRKFCSWCGHQGHFASECRKATNAGIASRLVHSYAEPESTVSRARDSVPVSKLSKKQKREKAAEHRRQTSLAEQGRAIVFGSDFIPLSGPSGLKKLKPTPAAANADLIQRLKKGKQTARSSAFATKVDAMKKLRKETRLEPEYGGIESLPSVQKRRRNNVSAQNSDDEKPRNRRKERRKLKRMLLRNDRDQTKKKNLKRKASSQARRDVSC